MASTPLDPPPEHNPAPAPQEVSAAAGPDADAGEAAGETAGGKSVTPPDMKAGVKPGAMAATPLAAAPADRLAVKAATAPAASNHPVLWTALVFAAVILSLAFLWGSREPVPDSPIDATTDAVAGTKADTRVDARSEILAIEQLLDHLAFPPGKIDGVADAETEGAIRDYQRAAGLPVDGYATPALLEELRAVTGKD